MSHRGFAEGRAELFPQDTRTDSTQSVGDFLFREEVFAKPLTWLQFAAGADLRANSHDRVEDEWRVDAADRGVRRPRVSLRRATATMAYGWLTLDIGRQFIRWGKADILNPTDRFAPRDFLNVVNTEFLPVTGARASVQASEHDSFELVWLPRFTPSRIPLLNQRWAAVGTLGPSDQTGADGPIAHIVDAGAVLPAGSQTGVRWSRAGGRAEYSLSFFNGFNHLPDIDATVKPYTPEIDIVRRYPSIRSYGADVALPTPWLTLKGEIAYMTSSSAVTDEYVTYVIQLERQTGEWVLVGGYAGEAVTERRALLTFAAAFAPAFAPTFAPTFAPAFSPDRGLTKSVVGRASYTVDPNRSLAFETAVRQNLAGAYGKVEYSQAHGQHWRTTAAGVIIGGDQDDFLGQYRRNSHVSLTLRYSF